MKIHESQLEQVIETKIKPNMKVLYNLKIQNVKDKYIAEALGISVPMFQKALEVNEEIKEVYQDAMMILISNLRDIVFSRALGTDGKRDKDGNLLGPDAELAFKLLGKLDEQFSNKVELKETLTIEHVIRQISEKKRAQIEVKEAVIAKNEARGIEMMEDADLYM